MRRHWRAARSNRRRRTLLAAAALIVVIAVAAWNLTRDQTTPGDPRDADQVALGADVYAQSCAKCHGRNLKGEFGELSEGLGALSEELGQLSEEFGKLQELSADSQVAPAHDVSGETWQHSDDQLFEITKFGGERLSADGKVSRMPAFARKLDDTEIWAVIAFIKSFWPEGVQEARRNTTTDQEAK